ncbi:related to delta 8-sphingolipid desaturase [Phialocephala subalpina]|uniref:Delta 8-(E)-sphingolipid desaturase n=1 Tax=Phialocephala subalpina TaxID=576137 RepID=A0A1L7X7R4_9HELO|nr:related to delta 8-sphingolipid desaturase [Phialocephala subalpina]
MGPSATAVLDAPYVEALVEDGHAVLVYNKSVLKLDSWLKHHPGGDKAILHFVGRDATDQINAFHSEETKESMLRYQIGVINKNWHNFIPPIQRASDGKNILELGREKKKSERDDESGTSSPSSSVFEPSGLRNRAHGTESPTSSISSFDNKAKHETDTRKNGQKEVSHDAEENIDKTKLEEDEIVSSFRGLVADLESRGFYDCNYWAYLTEAIRISCIGTVMLLLLHFKQYFLSAIALGTFWHQLVFIAHDAGHLGITHSYQIDTLIGLALSSTLGGLSLSWWKKSHNIHHLATNSPSHDPDIQHLPFMAISPSFFSSLYSTYYDRIMLYTPFAERMMGMQQWLYYPLLCLGRFNLYALSWEHLWLDRGPKNRDMWWHRPFEIVGQLVFWYWFGYRIVYLSLPNAWMRFMFVLISHAVTMPLHVQFTLSHFAMATEPGEDAKGENGKDESWARQQLRTTMDVDCPPWMDWFHGGLQFQAIHHLFPRLPRHNLRRTSEVVKVWSKEVGLRYEVYGFVECNGRVLGRLEEVGRQARFLRDAHKSVLESKEWLRGEWE